MKTDFLLLVAALAMLAGTVSAQEVQPVTLLPSEKEIAEISALLKTRYVAPVAIPAGKVSRTDFGKYLESLNGGAVLMEQQEAQAPVRAIRTEFLPGKIGYWRMDSFQPQKDWGTLSAQLGAWQRSGAIGLVLDVRDYNGDNEFGAAATAASYFTPPGTNLFSLQGMQIPQQVFANQLPQRAWNLPIIVLVSNRTAGPAEAFAACLRAASGAILMGQSTPGQAAVMVETQLRSGRFLRLATGQVRLADGTALFGHPVTPDIDIVMDEGTAKKISDKLNQGIIAPLLAERPARPHLSEASLVNNENPELEEAISNMKVDDKPDKPEGALQDTGLIRACDVLKGIDLKRKKNLPAPKTTDNGAAKKNSQIVGQGLKSGLPNSMKNKARFT